MRHGAGSNPPNRFERTRCEADTEHLDNEAEIDLDGRVEYFPDDSQTIVTENCSPDIPYRYTVNPYRGCAHGCSYCYARNTHEYLGLSAGLDFETKIMVKHRAPQLLKQFLKRPSWKGETLTFSGVTDCYQPAERKFEITRQCLEVALQFDQAVSIVTKNALITRDLSILQKLAERRLVRVFVSINSLDRELAGRLEPRTSIPEARLRTIQSLSDAKIPVGVMVAPVIPGLTDSEIPRVLAAAADAGAQSAGYILLRLPLTVEPIFREWLRREYPRHVKKVEGRLRAIHGGKLSESRWGVRLTGQGPEAERLRHVFDVFARKHQLDRPLPELDTTRFRSGGEEEQLRLF